MERQPEIKFIIWNFFIQRPSIVVLTSLEPSVASRSAKGTFLAWDIFDQESQSAIRPGFTKIFWVRYQCHSQRKVFGFSLRQYIYIKLYIFDSKINLFNYLNKFKYLMGGQLLIFPKNCFRPIYKIDGSFPYRVSLNVLKQQNI